MKEQKTRENSQVALIAWKQGHGFAGEPFDYVDEVHYFNSKKKANRFQIENWKSRGCPVDANQTFDQEGNFLGTNEFPDFRFQRVQRGTVGWKYAIQGFTEEMSVKQILDWIR